MCMHRFHRCTALFNKSLDLAGAHLKFQQLFKTAPKTNASPLLSSHGVMEAMYATVPAVVFNSIVDSKMTYLKASGSSVTQNITSKLCIHIATLAQARDIQICGVITVISHDIFHVKLKTA